MRNVVASGLVRDMKLGAHLHLSLASFLRRSQGKAAIVYPLYGR